MIGFVVADGGEAVTMSVRRRRFRGGAAAPRQARHALREAVGGALSQRALGDAELLVSELATNCVEHAGCDEDGLLAMEAAVRGDHVHVRLCDQGIGFDGARPGEPDAGRAGGFGLVLLDRIANDWGVQRGERFCVWFELSRN
jgi:anti-sigma regulatory factor (Ser/Thr protein kinase)